MLRSGIPKLRRAACLPVGGWNTDALNGAAGVAAVAMVAKFSTRDPCPIGPHRSGLFNGLIWPKAG